MKKLFSAAVIVLASPLLASGLEWQTLGIYKIFWNQYRVSLFNPDNACVEKLGMRDVPHFGLSQFLSVRFDALALEWQIDVLGSANRAAGRAWKTDLTVNQLFVQKTFFENLVFIAGRTIHRWGTGYAFNPTDVVGPEKILSDPDNNERGLVGNDLAMLEFFGKSYSVSLCGLTRLDLRSGIRARGSRLAFRFYKNIQHLDLSFVSLFKRSESPIWGLNFATAIGERLEIHGEAASQKGSYERYHPAAAGEMRLYPEDPLAPFKRNDGKYFRQFLLGFTYTFPGNVLWVSEYYHRDQGYSRKEWSRVTDYVSFLNMPSVLSMGESAIGNLLWTLQVFTAKGAMRDYWMDHVQIPVSSAWSITVTHLLNLEDFSFVMIPETTVQSGGIFTFYLRSYIFRGGPRSEYGAFFQSSAVEAGLRIRT